MGLAVSGLIAQHTWRVDFLYPYEAGPYDFTNVPSNLGAMGTNASGFIGLFALVAGLVELRASDDGRDPGDFGDPLKFRATYGLNFDGPDDKAQWQNFELNHGRLAMIGFLGCAFAEYATGLDAVDQWARAGSAFSRTFAILSPGGVRPVPSLDAFF